jgi:hypothetical protein
MKIKSSLLAACAVFFSAVPASAATVLTDTFDYPDGSLVGATGSPWVTHSGTAGQVNVTSNVVNLTSSESEDVSAPLAGQPYTVGKLTATFDVVFTALPTATGTYLAHFKNDTTGFRSRLYASTTGAAAGTFRLGISNANNGLATTVNVASDLSLNTAYAITMTWDLDTLVSTLAINAGTAVSATDTTGNTSISVQAFAFRQASGMGTSTIDNLVVTYIPEPGAAFLGSLGMLCLLRRRR